MAILLSMRGHHTQAFYDGPSVLAQTGSAPPDVAVLNLGLPGMDGFELARQLKAMAPPVRLLALSGYGQPADHERTESAGFDAHFVKPVDPSVLEAAFSPPPASEEEAKPRDVRDPTPRSGV